jgi:hypothetical protein
MVDIGLGAGLSGAACRFTSAAIPRAQAWPYRCRTLHEEPAMSGSRDSAESASANEALRLAVASGDASGKANPSEIVDRIRQAADQLQSARQEASDLRAGLSAMKDLAQRDAAAAQERVRSAEKRAELEASRADAAESRLAEAERQISELLKVIQEEFGDALPARSQRGTDTRPR